jgi:hypothetical protein
LRGNESMLLDNGFLFRGSALDRFTTFVYDCRNFLRDQFVFVGDSVEGGFGQDLSRILQAWVGDLLMPVAAPMGVLTIIAPSII